MSRHLRSDPVTGPSPLIAVGTALTGGPPHGSQRAELPHWAPTSGSTRRVGRQATGEARSAASCPRATARRTRSSPLDTPDPALRPERVGLSVFPSVGRLPSTASATARTALFGGFAGTTHPSDFPCPFISGVRPQPSLSGPPGDQPDGQTRDLPVLAHGGSTHARVLRPRGVRRQLAITRPAMLPSAKGHCVGTPN